MYTEQNNYTAAQAAQAAVCEMAGEESNEVVN